MFFAATKEVEQEVRIEPGLLLSLMNDVVDPEIGEATVVSILIKILNSRQKNVGLSKTQHTHANYSVVSFYL